ncbi:hypothetical protein [Pelobacter seleniigenes]|uniref:hypothetical protein n=1 Tax=Pelobacter seleniigenes TaxID=407188 RepID=UPI0004A72596|nr:hypothetical protein [Pelobacter seleniigenes]
MLNVLILIVTVTVASYLAFSKRLGSSASWQATVTPLASIMGSGFLISAPLLAGTVGYLAFFCMAALLLLAYGVGHIIRFNIRHFEPIENNGHGAAQDIAFLARVVLAGAYFISVAYYLQLLAAFLLSLINKPDPTIANLITTTLLLTIGGIGMWRGLGKLEKLESYAVSLNLGMIAALLVALGIYNIKLLSGGAWQIPAIPTTINLHDTRILLGLLIVVQGFETSRYLGDEHGPELRIRTMRAAQLISSVIYLVFIALMTVLFHSGLNADVTAIINLTRPVAAVLPVLLAIAAIGSQFSAAVADNLGAGGLLEDVTHHKLPVRYAYLIILIITVTLTWETDVNSIIAYASRAFALFYFLQSLVAVLVVIQDHSVPQRSVKLILFPVIALLCLLVFAFGLPAE